MSVTSISTKNRIRLWMLAAGRCEYRGCNIPLWRDDKTFRSMNKAYIAHIVADVSGGPRGHDVRSEQLKDTLTNLMLLCDECHRRIDVEDEIGHPEELLVQMKQDHEDRIEMLTGISPKLGTHVLTLAANIGEFKPQLVRSEILEAVVPGRCPRPSFLEIDLTTLARSDDENEYWQQTRVEVERQLDQLLRSPSDLAHVSAFGLAPIPILVAFGRRLGDIREVAVFQKFREGHPWKWKAGRAQNFTLVPPKASTTTEEVAVALSISGKVHLSEIVKELGASVPVYELHIAEPDVDTLRNTEMLADFRGQWRSLLVQLRKTHGENCRAHVFPAVPNAIAIEMGRAVLPKAHPELVLWDCQTAAGGYVETFIL